MNSKIQKIGLLIALLALLILESLYLFKTPIQYGFPGSIDFIQYWSSNSLIQAQKNPYQVSAMLAEQKQLGLVGENPIMMWVAPWCLYLLKPFLIFNFHFGFITFICFNISSLIFCSYLLQLTYSENRKFDFRTCLLGLFFIPAWDCVNYGQISILLLLALCLASYCLKKNKEALAAVFFSVLSIKPHLFIYLALATFIWALLNKKFKLIAFTLASSIFLISSFHIFHSTVIANWLKAVANYGSTGSIKTSEWAAASLGTWLRIIWGQEKTYLIWLPSFIGIFVLIKQVFKTDFFNRSYEQILPLLLSLSLLFSPYAWLYDQSLFLICQAFIFYRIGIKPLLILQAIYLMFKISPNLAQQHFALFLPLWAFYSSASSGENSEITLSR